jgi:deoxyribodipyrimidine photo-lyase
VLERDEVLTGAGRPFSVFTPYRNAWMRRLSPADLAERVVRFDGKLARPPAATRAAPGASDATTCDAAVPTLQSIGFQPAGLRELKIPTGMSGARSLLDDFLQRIGRYHEARDYPALRGPSYLSVHLRFGTVPARRLVRCAREVIDGDPAGAEGARVWLSELVWREFYQQVLHHHPHVAGAAFRPEYDRIAWETGPRADELFAAWREARTGYPLVDAAMAQIERSGYMHNRLRMVAASFLTKDLGIDWRRGEAHFAAKLIDFDLAANNGGWQWAASSGCDAQPWFRIFNPVTQSLKFDPQGRFIRRYLPRLAALPDRAIHAPWLATPAELAAAGVELGRDYPRPVVDHDEARRRTLARYEAVKSRSVSPPGAGDSR